MGRKTRKAQKGGIRLLDSNFRVPRVGYYEAGIFEGAPGSNNIGADRWIYNPVSYDLTTIPGLGEHDTARLRRVKIDNTVQLLGRAMILAGSTPGSGANLILYLRKLGIRNPALVARMLVEKIDNMFLRPTDYANPIVPTEPNDVEYPDFEIPELTIADFADANRLSFDEAFTIYSFAQAHGLELNVAHNVYKYAQKFGLTLEKVFEIVQARASYFEVPITTVINLLPRQIAAFDRRRHALAAYAAAENAAAAASGSAAAGRTSVLNTAAANGINAAAANAAEDAAGAASSTRARRQTRRRRHRRA